MSSVSLQDSQLQFYDAIEDFSESDTGSDSGSEQESEIEAANESVAKSKKPAIVPGNQTFFFLYYKLRIRSSLHQGSLTLSHSK